MIETRVYQLDLPAPSLELIQAVKQYVDSVELNKDNKRWLDEFHDHKINSALHLFTGVESLNSLVQKEFEHYFPNKIAAVVGIMKNNSTTPACQPPHIDRYRALAINYFIELGGDRVETVFYDYEEPTSIDSSKNLRYSEVKKIGSYIFDKNTWYAFNVSQCHSIENIVGTRYFLSIANIENSTDYKIDQLLNNVNGKLLWSN